MDNRKQHLEKILKVAKESLARRVVLAKRFYYYIEKLQVDGNGVHHIPQEVFAEMLREPEIILKPLKENVFGYIKEQNKNIFY